MPIHEFIPYLLSVCATITIKMATKLGDNFYFLNSAVTLTSKVQGQMINCLCLQNALPYLHETKAVWTYWLINFISDLRRWPCLCTLTLNFQGQIVKLPYLWNILPDRKKGKRGWIVWMVWYFVNNIWPTFCVHCMLQCRSGVTFLSLATSVGLISIATAMVCI